MFGEIAKKRSRELTLHARLGRPPVIGKAGKTRPATINGGIAPPPVSSLQRGRRAMEFFSGLDVGMDETAICVVDDKGKVALETTVVTDPETIKAALKPYLGRLRRLGHEAGSLSPWLHPELLKLGLPAVCLETQHVRAALKAQRNKTDKADALGIAHLMRTGWFRKAHIKSEACYRLRLLLTHRRNLKRKCLDLENAIRHSLKAFGVRISGTGRGGFAQAVREAVAGDRAGQRADRRHAERARRAVEGVLAACTIWWSSWWRPRAVPALHADPGCRTGGGAELHDGDR